jgi:translation initiation factor 2 subunit 1
MLYIKDGFPEVNELVYCTVTKIYGNTVFVQLDEYEKEGVLTISEIKQGRIRNIRDFVSEGRKIVCKVIKVTEKQNRIDVSLRRVSIPMKKEKLEEIKKEEFSEKVYEFLAKEFSMTKDELFEKTYEPIFENYETVFEALYDIMLDNNKIEMFDQLTPEQKKIFVEYINEKIKPEKVVLKQKFKLFTLTYDGIEAVKSAISKGLEGLENKDISVTYLAAGTYLITIIEDDMKTADSLFKTFKNQLEAEIKNKKFTCEFLKEQ